MSKELIEKMSQEMAKGIQTLQRELAKLRTGRASTALLDGLHVDYYGSASPLSQVANITTPDARTLQLVPWEQTMIGAIEKAILAANIGLTPQNDGKLIRISLPALNEERRKDMVKQLKKMGEETKVGIRNIRRDTNEEIKKSKSLTEDESKKMLEQIQKKTDEKVADVDKVIALKEKEIMTI